ncbi:MAG: peptidase [Candidatus Scalindua rubra]|uniref:Peptidase n=1 Tax=Candidatus Scalindua rubra TaxID=1872076 RepID=A0A1E3X333_9BACT|nr:MAG: peptidase [Candidatus Scalindua rubra]
MNHMVKDNKKLLQEALKLHQTGNLDAAANLYNKILEEQPDNIDAISLLGALNLQTGNLDVACVFLKKALALKPDNAMAHNNLGSALQASGRLDEAIASYKQAITLKPDYDEAYYNLGSTLQKLGRFEEAIASYKQAITLKPNDADAHSNLGNALRKNGKPDEALVSYRHATLLKPGDAELHSNLGAALQELGRFDEAILSYKQAIALKPEFAMAHSNLGTALKKQGKFEEAMKSYNRAIELKPDYAEAHNNLGFALQELGRFDEAIAIYKRAIAFKPDYAEAYYNLGNTLKEQNKLDEAVASYMQAISLKPDYAEAHNNLGIAFQEQGKLNEAVTGYSRAIELKPDYADAHFNKSLTSLLKGNFKKGWQEYEWRLRTKDYALKPFRQPMWDGSPLNGKSILVHAEQGIGDIIQFVRYLPMIQAQGGHVIFECRQVLLRLLKNCAGIDKIIERTPTSESAVQFDVHVPFLSLPGIFGATPDNIPADIPYIIVDSKLASQWHMRFVHDNGFKIGIVWAGNPHNKRDHNRSCSLADFATLAEIPELSFYSLQKGPTSEGKEGMKITNLENELNDFTDTAAAIANLDLVISVDTAVAHLAGAIGKPVWTLLPLAPDWRWLLKRNDSPWYPSMRLFRQTQLKDWNGVFEQVKEALISNFGLQIADCGKKSVCRIPKY